MQKVIDWKLGKKLKFRYFKKCYIHKPEAVIENEVYKILREFEMNRLCNHVVKKKLVDFAVPADQWVETKESKKIRKIPGCCEWNEKTAEHEGDEDTCCSRWLSNGPQRPRKQTGSGDGRWEEELRSSKPQHY